MLVPLCLQAASLLRGICLFWCAVRYGLRSFSFFFCLLSRCIVEWKLWNAANIYNNEAKSKQHYRGGGGGGGGRERGATGDGTDCKWLLANKSKLCSSAAYYGLNCAPAIFYAYILYLVDSLQDLDSTVTKWRWRLWQLSLAILCSQRAWALGEFN